MAQGHIREYWVAGTVDNNVDCTAYMYGRILAFGCTVGIFFVVCWVRPGVVYSGDWYVGHIVYRNCLCRWHICVEWE